MRAPVSDEKEFKPSPGPHSGPEVRPRVPGSTADTSDLERTRELPPGSIGGGAWPRPAPRSVGPLPRAPSKPASGLPSKPPAPGRNPFANLPSTTPRPPGQKPAVPSIRPAKPAAAAAPNPPSWGVEELSGSLLLPDDGLSEPGLPQPGVEELSGSVLVEDGPDGGPPIVTRTGGASPAHKAAAEPAHRALLGIPELPKSTPGPAIDALSPADPHAVAPAPDGPAPPDEPAIYRLDDSSEDAAAPDSASEEPSEPPITQSSAPAPAAIHRDDVEVTALPRSKLVTLLDTARSKLAPLLATLQTRLRAAGLVSARQRPPWFWPAIIVPALALGAGFVALVGSLTGTDRSSSDPDAAGSSVASSSVATSSASPPVALPVAPAQPAAPVATAAAPLRPCVVEGSSINVAPKAIVGAGVEVRPFGEDFAVGFAPDDHEAVAMRLNAGSLATISTARARSKDLIRRVRPVATAKGGLVLAVDADRKGDRLNGRRTLPVDPPLQVGALGSSLVWAHAGGPAAGALWTLDGDGDLEALRGATEGAPGDTTTVLAFRRGNSIGLGAATGYRALSAKGDLTRVDGLGTAIGSPAVALNDGVVIAAWADRASSNQPWNLRWVRFKAGEAPGSPKTFSPPAGGQGGQAMSPGLAAVPGGRFLLVWTEGPASFHHVRALTLSGEGAPVGAPLEVSADGANAGQGQAAVGAAGTGLVAFLESADGGFRVVATPVACGGE